MREALPTPPVISMVMRNRWKVTFPSTAHTHPHTRRPTMTKVTSIGTTGMGELFQGPLLGCGRRTSVSKTWTGGRKRRRFFVICTCVPSPVSCPHFHGHPGGERTWVSGMNTEISLLLLESSLFHSAFIFIVFFILQCPLFIVISIVFCPPSTFHS